MYYNENELPAILTFAEAVEYLYIGRNTLLIQIGLDRIKPYNVILFCRIDTSEQ